MRRAAPGTPREAAATIARALLAPLEAPASDAPLPVWLLPHQGEAVARARGILERFGGVLVADGVGLGKTYIALALAALERRDGGDAMAIVPAAIADEWQRAMARTGVVVPLRTHACLVAREEAEGAASLLLVDEAHAFRNPRTRRYNALARLAVGRRVALLTATPFNNGPADVVALLALFAGRDRFRHLGVADVAEDLRSAGARPAQLALGAISVCRTRRLVERRWPDLVRAFPRRVLEPPARYDLDACYGGRLSEVLDGLEAVARTMRDAEDAAALVHLGLLRRLESTPAALAASLRHHRAFAEDACAAARSGRRLTRRQFVRARGRRVASDQLLLWDLLLGQDSATAAPLASVLEAVRDVEDAVSAVLDQDADAKVQALRGLLDRTALPAIVFTEYRATALHLMRQLRHRYRVLTVTGPDAWAGADRIARADALDAFAPIGRGRRPQPLLAADVLVTTDVASEGMNLQDARLVVNFDLPWNPVRIMQRAGRIDRLGSPHDRVHLAHLLPAAGLDRITGVLARLRRKLEQAAVAPTAEPDPLAALWWLDQGPGAAGIDAEAWRRVAPFEAWERWQALLDGEDRGRPVVAGAVTADGSSGVGLLLTLSWRDHPAVPLPFVIRHGGAVAEDAVGLTELAEQAGRGRPVSVEASQLAEALATVLPLARARAGALHASWRGAVPMGPGRRAVLAILDRETLRARRDREPASATEDAAARLLRDVPAGVERQLADLARSGVPAVELARTVTTLTSRIPGPDWETPAPPRIALAAALVVSVACPGRD